jgi:hypothetical protein
MTEQIHDNYGKELLRQIAGALFISSGDSVKVRYGGGVSASVDGIIDHCCAIEIESRVAKQIRGALLDLLEHPLSRKLLIIIPAHMYNPANTAKHCEYILEKYKRQGQVTRVILLRGTGNNPKQTEDKERIRTALTDLECL